MKNTILICLFALSLSGFAQNKKASNLETITVGGGCYWCVEAVYENLDGVKSVVSGFSGGKVANPTYE